jgi:hypothetical protein
MREAKSGQRATLMEHYVFVKASGAATLST